MECFLNIDKQCFIEYDDFTKRVKGVKIMKLNYTESQYEQLAREQFCKTFDEIPFVSDIEITSSGKQHRFCDFHAVVHFEDDEKPIDFWIEVKSKGERRYVKEFMNNVELHNNDGCWVFMSPFFSEESAKIMKNKKVSYMDLSGNCYILTKRIMLYVSGQTNKYIERREKKNYLSKSSSAASTIMRTMLETPNEEWGVKMLAEKTGKAIGTVSNVKSFLNDKDWIKDSQNGFKLCDIRERLYVWARDYHKKNSRTYEFYSLDNIAEIEQEIAKWSGKHDESAILGSFSAAARYAPTVRYNKVEVYVEQQYFDEFVRDLDLQMVNSGGNVIITIPHDETPCLYYRKINESFVTSPVQTILDLLGNSGRGEEAAEAIITKEYRGIGNDKG